MFYFYDFSFSSVIMRFQGPVICRFGQEFDHLLCLVYWMRLNPLCHLECLAACLFVHKAASVSSCHLTFAEVRMEPAKTVHAKG